MYLFGQLSAMYVSIHLVVYLGSVNLFSYKVIYLDINLDNLLSTWLYRRFIGCNTMLVSIPVSRLCHLKIMIYGVTSCDIMFYDVQ